MAQRRVVGQKKVVGILAETTPLSDQLCLILGIGLNVNMSKEMLEAIDQPAASMLSISGKTWEVEEVLDKLTKRFTRNLDGRYLCWAAPQAHRCLAPGPMREEAWKEVAYKLSANPEYKITLDLVHIIERKGSTPWKRATLFNKHSELNDVTIFKICKALEEIQYIERSRDLIKELQKIPDDYKPSPNTENPEVKMVRLEAENTQLRTENEKLQKELAHLKKVLELTK